MNVNNYVMNIVIHYWRFFFVFMMGVGEGYSSDSFCAFLLRVGEGYSSDSSCASLLGVDKKYSSDVEFLRSFDRDSC